MRKLLILKFQIISTKQLNEILFRERQLINLDSEEALLDQKLALKSTKLLKNQIF